MEPPYAKLQSALESSDTDMLVSTIVNAPFKYKGEMVLLGIGIIVLLIHDKTNHQIRRVALSKTEIAEGTLKISLKKFEDIIIPDDDQQNIIAQVITDKQPLMTDDWRYLFTPALSPDQARLNQAGGGIACSYVYPLQFASDEGALIYSYYVEPQKVGKKQKDFMKKYSQLVSDRLATATDHHLITSILKELSDISDASGIPS